MKNVSVVLTTFILSLSLCGTVAAATDECGTMAETRVEQINLIASLPQEKAGDCAKVYAAIVEKLDAFRTTVAVKLAGDINNPHLVILLSRVDDGYQYNLAIAESLKSRVSKK